MDTLWSRAHRQRHVTICLMKANEMSQLGTGYIFLRTVVSYEYNYHQLTYDAHFYFDPKMLLAASNSVRYKSCCHC